MKQYSFVQEALVAEELGDANYRKHHNQATAKKFTRTVKAEFRPHTAKTGNLASRRDPFTVLPSGKSSHINKTDRARELRNLMNVRKTKKFIGGERAKNIARSGLKGKPNHSWVEDW